MAGSVSDTEEFAALLLDFVGIVELITRLREEPRIQAISLPAEYRWDVDTNTQYLLDHSEAPFSVEERTEIEGFVQAVRSVPAKAPELDDAAWKLAQAVGQKLLPMLLAHQETVSRRH